MTEGPVIIPGAATPGADDPKYRWKVLFCVIFGVFMVILDTTVVNVAFPTLRREYGATLDEAQWIVSVYVLALGMATPLAGYMSERFGIKRVYVMGLGAFVAGSALCGLAPSLGFLIFARIIQGIGGGIALPLGSAQLFAAFPPREQGKAFGYFGIAILVAPALGPVMGGMLVDQGLWRWIFFVNLPIGAFGVFMAQRWLRERPHHRRPGLDLTGLVLACLAFGGMLYGASIAAERGWQDLSTLAWLGTGLASFAVLVYLELQVAEEPLIDFRLFQNRTFTYANLVGYVSALALFGAEFMMPVYLQTLRGQSSLESGITLIPIAIGAGIASPIAGRLYDRVGPRPLVVIGFLLLVINNWQFSLLDRETSIPLIMMLLGLRGVALGMTMQTTFATAMGSVPREKLARGSSLINSTRNVVQSLGVAIMATIIASEKADPLLGFEAAYRLTFYISIVAVAIGALLPGWPGRWTGREGLSRAAST